LQVPVTIKLAAKTDKGLVRSGNEDYLHLDEDSSVYAVCDGMGGHQAGEVASMTASETVLKTFTHFRQPLLEDSRLNLDLSLPPNGELLVKSIRLANRAIYNLALRDSNMAGMGTTIVAVAPEGDIMSVAHVGDSRAYRLNKKALEPLTKDHSWVAEIQESQNLSAEEASTMVGKNVITRALGVRESVEVDFRVVKIQPGDLFILCSDGLCGFADDDEIFDVADRSRDDLDRLVGNLVQMANDRGGSDNVSVIALEVTSCGSSSHNEAEVITLPEESEEVQAVADEWLKKYAELVVELKENKAPAESTSGVKPMLLLSFFVLFVVVAALIIWLRSG
jgi:protein phosphatase